MKQIAMGWLLGIAVLFVLGGGIVGAYFVSQNHQRLDQYHNGICFLGRLFGLDRPLPPAQLRKLRPIQIHALNEVYSTCPQLGQKEIHP